MTGIPATTFNGILMSIEHAFWHGTGSKHFHLSAAVLQFQWGWHVIAVLYMELHARPDVWSAVWQTVWSGNQPLSRKGLM